MIVDIKQIIADKLKELYSTSKVYVEDVPQNFKTASFMITLTNQDYSKRLNTVYKSTLSFDIAYFSNRKDNEIKDDCHIVQMNLFRSFDLVGGYRILNKQAVIVDIVLHFTFDIVVSEMLQENYTKMQKQRTNTNI